VTRRERIAAVLCVIVHAAVVANVWYADQHTPRVINILLCPAAQPSLPDTVVHKPHPGIIRIRHEVAL
jgi:hypothetical protein